MTTEDKKTRKYRIPVWHWIRKRWFIITFSILVFIILILLLLPGFAKNYLTQNSEDLIGRKIELKELKINYFSFSITAEGFVMYEADKTDTFASFDEFFVNFSPWQLLKSEYSFSEIRLVEPSCKIVLIDSVFNFSDLIPPEDTTETDTTSEVKYNIKNLSISRGKFLYKDLTTNNLTSIKNFNVKIPEISWGSSKSDVGVGFILGDKGKVSLDGAINPQEGFYNLRIKTADIDLNPFSDFVKPFLDISSLDGLLSTDLRLNGSMSDPMDLTVVGKAALNSFRVMDASVNEFCFVEQLRIEIDSIDLGREQYHIGRVEIQKPRFNISVEPETTNIDRILSPLYAESGDSSGDTIKPIQDTAPSSPSRMHYSIKNFIVSNALINFKDLTLNRSFQYEVSSIDINMRDFSDLASGIPLDFKMILDNTGSFAGNIILNMINTETLGFEGVLRNMNLISFSPYSEYWLRRPITRGAFNYRGMVDMTPVRLTNRNHVKITNLEMGKKTGDTTAYKVPVGIALFVLKDRKGVIEFDLPVSGNPSSPTFKLRKIILKTLEEFLIKTAASPFNTLGKMFGFKPEDVREIPFDLLQDTLDSDQVKRLEMIADVLQAKPELSCIFIQTTNPGKEVSLLALRESKIRYAKSLIPGITTENSVKIADTLAFDNPGFIRFLGLDTVAGIQDMLDASKILIGEKEAAAMLRSLMQSRQDEVLSFLMKKNIPPGSVTFSMANLNNLSDEMMTPKFVVELAMN